MIPIAVRSTKYDDCHNKISIFCGCILYFQMNNVGLKSKHIYLLSGLQQTIFEFAYKNKKFVWGV